MSFAHGPFALKINLVLLTIGKGNLFCGNCHLRVTERPPQIARPLLYHGPIGRGVGTAYDSKDESSDEGGNPESGNPPDTAQKIIPVER